MKVNHIIIHEVKKEANVTGAELDLSETTLPSDSEAVNLISKLNKRY